MCDKQHICDGIKEEEEYVTHSNVWQHGPQQTKSQWQRVPLYIWAKHGLSGNEWLKYG